MIIIGLDSDETVTVRASVTVALPVCSHWPSRQRPDSESDSDSESEHRLGGAWCRLSVAGPQPGLPAAGGPGTGAASACPAGPGPGRAP